MSFQFTLVCISAAVAVGTLRASDHVSTCVSVCVQKNDMCMEKRNN